MCYCANSFGMNSFLITCGVCELNETIEVSSLEDKTDYNRLNALAN